MEMEASSSLRPASSSAAVMAAMSASPKPTVLRLARLHQASPRVGWMRDRAAIGGDALGLLADGLQDMRRSSSTSLAGRAGASSTSRYRPSASSWPPMRPSAAALRLPVAESATSPSCSTARARRSPRRRGSAVEDGRQIGAGRREAGRQLEGAAQQILGVAQPADARRQLGHHADRGDVGRAALEVGRSSGSAVGRSLATSAWPARSRSGSRAAAFSARNSISTASRPGDRAAQSSTKRARRGRRQRQSAHRPPAGITASIIPGSAD